MKMHGAIPLILLILVSSCAVEPGWETFQYSAKIPIEIDSVDQALAWCADNITYKTDQDVHGESYWQTPEETYALRSGDCEDFALLFMYLVSTNLGLKTELLIVGYNSPAPNHAIAVIGSEWYETTGGFKISDRSAYISFQTVDYQTSMWQSAAYHAGLL